MTPEQRAMHYAASAAKRKATIEAKSFKVPGAAPSIPSSEGKLLSWLIELCETG